MIETAQQKLKRLVDEWAGHVANGMDVLASVCLDEIEAMINQLRP